MAIPAVATGALCFFAGGFFPETTAFAAIVGVVGIVLRLTISERPWRGWTVGASIATGALALFAAWILASSQWSGAPARALVEFDRVLLYLCVVLLFAFFPSRATDIAAVLRWVAAVLGLVCIVALVTRLLPETFPTSRIIANDRLTFPLTYWNAMGILSALALILALHVSSSVRESAVARVLAAGAAPAAASTLYFTFSRGGIAAAVIGLVLYLLLGHPRGLLPALLAIVPTTAYALIRAYRADLLATTKFADPIAASQRRDVLFAVIVCMVAAVLVRMAGLRIDRRIERIHLARRPSRGALALAGGLAVIALGGFAVATNLPHRIDQQRREFARGAILPGQADLRGRLTQRGNNGRVANWRVALNGFDAEPLHGTGAGTYRLQWERERPRPPFQVSDGHSLYLETASELGLPGLLLLCVALFTPLVVALTRLRRPERHATAAFVAAGAALLVHAGVDWDWEIPALFLWFFGAGAVVLAQPDHEASAAAPGRLTRLLAGLACLAVLVTPALVLISQSSLDRGVSAFKRGDCRTAIDASLDSLGVLDTRPEPFEVLGYCDARAGRQDLAVRAMRAARQRDPENWQFAYGLAVVQALAGEDPRPAAALALRLNPLELLTRRLARGLRSNSPARRRAFAGNAPIPFD